MTAAESDDSDTQPVSGSPGASRPDSRERVSADPLLGQRLGSRYEILEVLGQGGMATVYLARDLNTGQRVVVKVPHENVIDRFELEALMHAKVDYNHIVKVRELGRVTVDGIERPFIIAEFKAGGDLSGRLKGGARRAEEVVEWLRPVARALDHSHALNLVHRDVKPENILFDTEGFVFLSDFGIAKRIGTTSTSPGPASSSTVQGTVIGTPGYIPPEAAVNPVPTPAYDQFSLAVVAAYALTGTAPKRTFPSDKQHLLSRLSTRFLSIRRALSDAPNDRFLTCIQFIDALKEEAAKPPIPIWLASTATAVIAIGVGLWLTWPPGPDPPPPPPPPPPPDELTSKEPRNFELGSSPREQQEAIALCKQHIAACNPEWYANETLRPVLLAPFELDRTEVTVGQFRKFVSDNSEYQTDAERRGKSSVIATGKPFAMAGLTWNKPGWNADDHEPVVHVSRTDAEAYCSWAGGRLPTRDEWEAGARGTERRVFPWGGEWEGNKARWQGGDSVRKPARVKQFPAAPDGYFDLAGNVWEWTSSDEGAKAILKGGSWAESNPANLRSAAQLIEDASYSSDDTGFRCARTADAWPEPAS